MGKKKLTKEMWAYIAGYVDGEGCIYVDSSTHVLRLQINTCYPGILHWIHENFGGPPVNPCRQRKQENHRNTYRWAISGAVLKPFLIGILPYAREKKSQIKLGLDYLASGDKLKKAEIAIQIKALKRVIFYEKNITN